MKKEIYVFFIFFISVISFAQKNSIDTTYFVIDNRKEFDNANLLDKITNEFCVYRKFISNNIFVESNLFGNNRFKVVNKKWYIKNKKKWILFFSPEIFSRKKIVEFYDSGFSIFPIEKTIFNGDNCYKYRVCINKSTNSTNMYVIFNPVIGIIALIDGKQILIRTNKIPEIHLKCK